MGEDWRVTLQADAEACLARLTAEDPRFELDAEQPAYRGGTHFVTFGRFEERPAAFKRFVAPRRWRNESACLRLLQAQALVPVVFHEEPETLIVMERLGGVDVMATASAPPSLGRAVGKALGRLSSFVPPTEGGYDPRIDFPDWGWSGGLRNVVHRCGTIGRRTAALFDPPRRGRMEGSLARIEERLPEVERERWGLFHEDVTNLRADGGDFVGLYDLELCRGATASMQLGAALNLCLSGPFVWEGLQAGFQEMVGSVDRRSAVAMHHLSCWIRICDAPTPEERRVAAVGYAATMDAAEQIALGV